MQINITFDAGVDQREEVRYRTSQYTQSPPIRLFESPVASLFTYDDRGELVTFYVHAIKITPGGIFYVRDEGHATEQAAIAAAGKWLELDPRFHYIGYRNVWVYGETASRVINKTPILMAA